MDNDLPIPEGDNELPPYHGDINHELSAHEHPVPWDNLRRYEPDDVVQSIEGTVLSEDGRIRGYVPHKTYYYLSTHLVSVRDAAHNAQMLKAMRETGMTERWWRFSYFTHAEDPGANFWGFVIVTAGLGLFFAPLWFWHPKKKNQRVPRPPLREMTIGFQQKGWIIRLVPEIKINWHQVYQNFADEEKMQNIVLAIQGQEPLQGADARPEWGIPVVCPTAPGGEWARENEYAKNEPICLRFSYMWIFTISRKNLRKAWCVEHGITGPTTISAASSLLMVQERKSMRELVQSGFKGMAVAIWPPVEFLE